MQNCVNLENFRVVLRICGGKALATDQCDYMASYKTRGPFAQISNRSRIIVMQEQGNKEAGAATKRQEQR